MQCRATVAVPVVSASGARPSYRPRTRSCDIAHVRPASSRAATRSAISDGSSIAFPTPTTMSNGCVARSVRPDEVAYLPEDIRRDGRPAVVGDGDRAVPPGRPAEGRAVRPLAAHPHGNARLLHRRRLERHVVDPVLFPLIGERLAAPQPRQHVETLVQLSRPELVVGLLAKRRELRVGRTAESHPEDQPAVGEVVDRYCRTRHLPRPAT